MKLAWTQDGYLCLTVTGGNLENAEKLMRIICRDALSSGVQSGE